MIRRHILLVKKILKRILVTNYSTKKSRKSTSPAKITNNHRQSLLGDHQVPPKCPDIAEESKKSLYFDYCMQKSVEIIFPLRCSHFIFLEETALSLNLRNIKIHELPDFQYPKNLNTNQTQNCPSILRKTEKLPEKLRRYAPTKGNQK